VRKERVVRAALQYHMGLHSAKPTLSCKAGSFSRTRRRRYCIHVHVKGKQYLCSLLFACCFGADSELMKAQAYFRPRTSTSFKHGFATGNNCQGGQCTPEVD
jgi:hypothetical protein